MLLYSKRCFKAIKIVLCAAILVASGLRWGVAEADENKMTVAVVEFQVKGDIGIPDAGAIIAEWMIGALIDTGKFQLNERVLLTKVLEEQSFSESGLVDQATIAKAGKLFGVDAIVTGSVLQWGETTSVTARLIDTESGEIIKAADVKVSNAEQIPNKIITLAHIIAGPDIVMEASPVIHEAMRRYDIVGTWKRWVAFSNSLAGFHDNGKCEMKHVFKTKVPNKRSSRYRASSARAEIDASESSTKRSKPYEGVWTSEGNTVEVRWDTGLIDTMIVSSDGQTMTGKNNWGFDVTCTKILNVVDIEQ